MEGVNMREYRPGTAITIDINALIDNDAHLTFVEVVTDHEEDETIFTLANELCELVAEDGETCCIDHKITGTADLYDLVSAERDGAAHFILSGHDIGLM